jgi:hypothetical protein
MKNPEEMTKKEQIIDGIATVIFMLVMFAIVYFIFIITPDPFYG